MIPTQIVSDLIGAIVTIQQYGAVSPRGRVRAIWVQDIPGSAMSYGTTYGVAAQQTTFPAMFPTMMLLVEATDGTLWTVPASTCQTAPWIPTVVPTPIM